MPPACEDLLRHCLLLDIEVNEKNVIYALGAVLGEQTFQVPAGEKIDRDTLAELDAFAADARYVLGHNILNHDLPRLRLVAPDLRFLRKPKIDTLFLSPLAYPGNPYHRLIKNYQLVRDSINDPVQDALLAGRVFAEQWDALVGQFAARADIPLLYRGFLATDAMLAGTAEALAAMSIPLLTGEDLVETFAWFARERACKAAVEQLVLQLADGALPTAPLAYVTAWLSVAGGNSVLPPWVPSSSTSCGKTTVAGKTAPSAGPTTTRRNSSRTTTGSRPSGPSRPQRTGTACRKRSSMPRPAAAPCSPPCRPAAANRSATCCRR
jgi:ATP-dependent DNA helicase RecQ